MGPEIFGADWPLVKDALVIAALAVSTGIGLGAMVFRRRRKQQPETHNRETPRGATLDLEGRVRVLERIATDRPHDLAAEIEALRGQKTEAI